MKIPNPKHPGGLEWSAASLAKARKTVASGRLHVDEQFAEVWWVTSERPPHDVYRVQTDGTSWITCTCAHGMKKGGGLSACYHTAAVVMELERHGYPNPVTQPPVGG